MKEEGIQANQEKFKARIQSWNEKQQLIQEHNASIASLNENNRKLVNDIEKQKGVLDSKLGEIEQLAQQVKQLSQEHEEHMQQQEGMQAKINELNNQLDKCLKDNDTLKQWAETLQRQKEMHS